jgi:hypothetical protein
MRGRLSAQLRNIVTAAPVEALGGEAPQGALPVEARRVARTLRMEAERATKGRACRFSEAAGGLRAILEGRDAEAVARQVARRFEREPGWRALVERDRGGALVILQPMVDEVTV